MQQQNNKISKLIEFLSHNAQVSSIAVFLMVCIIGFSLSTDAFFTSSNLLNLLRQSAPLMCREREKAVVTARLKQT